MLFAERHEDIDVVGAEHARGRVLCSAGCTEDRSMQIRWQRSTEDFNQQLQDLTHGVPGIRDHSGIQPKKRVAMVISLPKPRRGGLASLNLKREMRRAE